MERELLAVVKVDRLAVHPRCQIPGYSLFGRDALMTAETIIDDYAAPVACIVSSILGTVWQDAGLPECIEYGDNGGIRRYGCV